MGVGKGRVTTFPWYGSKLLHLSFVLPLLPPDARCFVDVYGGSGAVSFNVTPYEIMHYNDIDNDLANFMRVLRDDGDTLIHALSLTPHARRELEIACGPTDGISDLERARRLFVRARQTFQGRAQTSSSGSWAYKRDRGHIVMNYILSMWSSKVDGLARLLDRVRLLQIDNRPALDVIERMDTAGALFYLDPPYVPEARRTVGEYGYEMTTADHRALAAALHGIKGRAVLSGYRCELYDELYEDWHRVDDNKRKSCAVQSLKEVQDPYRRESCWLNFDPATLPQPDLFGARTA